jgi:hypothetical protein
MNYLIYSSHRTAICTDQEIEKILDSCKKNNPKNNLTGILFHSKNYFLQYLEGEIEDITRLYDTLKKDPRHEKVMILKKGTTDKRYFPDWYMGYKDVNTNEIVLKSQASEDELSIFDALLQGDNEHLSGKDALSILIKFYQII